MKYVLDENVPDLVFILLGFSLFVQYLPLNSVIQKF